MPLPMPMPMPRFPNEHDETNALVPENLAMKIIRICIRVNMDMK